jgi:hypothetical protein
MSPCDVVQTLGVTFCNLSSVPRRAIVDIRWSIFAVDYHARIHRITKHVRVPQYDVRRENACESKMHVFTREGER